jgi:hypothetical protein
VLPQPRPLSSVIRRALASAGRAILRALKVFFIILLVIIPVPVAALFTSVLKTRRRTESAQLLKKD